jgi:hypothetical protein
MQLDFTTVSTGRGDYGLPEARLCNVMVEPTQAGPTRSARLVRPGLTELYEVGTGPVVGMYQGSGVFGGDGFVVSGGELYQGTVLIGVVNRARLARFAALADQLVVVAGGNAYTWDGETLEVNVDSDLPAVKDVATLGGRAYYLVDGSDRIYASDIGDAASVDALSFFTAESDPDPGVGLLVLYDELWVFGETTVEPFSQTGDPDNPLSRSLGRRFNRGCAAQASIVAMDNSAFWLGDDRVIYRAADRPLRVSDNHLEGLLRACDDIASVTAFKLLFEGHELYVVNIPDQGSWAYDVSNPKLGWVEWASFGLGNFRCAHGVIADGLSYLGDRLTGKVWSVDPDAYTDGGEPVELVCAAAVTAGVQQWTRCDNIVLEGAVGVGPEDGSDPQVELRYSDDKGKTWSPWRARSLGTVGKYGQVVRWNGLGRFQRQRLFEVRSTADVLRSVAALHMNV